MGRRERRRKQLHDDIMEKGICLKLKGAALDRYPGSIRFGRGNGLVKLYVVMSRRHIS
jgi:hypothetical protein